MSPTFHNACRSGDMLRERAEEDTESADHRVPRKKKKASRCGEESSSHLEEKWSSRHMGRTKQRQDVHEGSEAKCREQERNLKRVCAEGGKAGRKLETPWDALQDAARSYGLSGLQHTALNDGGKKGGRIRHTCAEVPRDAAVRSPGVELMAPTIANGAIAWSIAGLRTTSRFLPWSAPCLRAGYMSVLVRRRVGKGKSLRRHAKSEVEETRIDYRAQPQSTPVLNVMRLYQVFTSLFDFLSLPHGAQVKPLLTGFKVPQGCRGFHAPCNGLERLLSRSATPSKPSEAIPRSQREARGRPSEDPEALGDVVVKRGEGEVGGAERAIREGNREGWKEKKKHGRGNGTGEWKRIQKRIYAQKEPEPHHATSPTLEHGGEVRSATIEHYAFAGRARILVAHHPDRTLPPPRSPRSPPPRSLRKARPDAPSSPRRLSCSPPLVAGLGTGGDGGVRPGEREAGKKNGMFWAGEAKKEGGLERREWVGQRDWDV
ncbi:hypothetical protein B0H14DRAFT_3150020 [Mycena olivaceomarginata]|nr:hypothetical protein B0H14DRAFT_3150020 [Mycena olivaceomarginata]